ncbi:MAG: hypothetical protein ACOCTN_00215 [Candidatus Natronoplasma sp.]
MADTEVMEERDIMGRVKGIMDVLADAAVDVIVNATVLVGITVDTPVNTEKVHRENSHLKKKKEKNLKRCEYQAEAVLIQKNQLITLIFIKK